MFLDKLSLITKIFDIISLIVSFILLVQFVFDFNIFESNTNKYEILRKLLETKNFPEFTKTDILIKAKTSDDGGGKLWITRAIQYLELPPVKKYTYTTQELNSIEKEFQQNYFGQEKAKRMLLQALLLPNNKKQIIIGLQGKPGIGKTKIVSTIAKLLNRKFEVINVCGRDKHSSLHGNSSVYVNSSLGPIAKGLLNSKSLNPIFFIDEIDKTDETIQNSFLQILDPLHQQNFMDLYLDPIPLDISQVDYVFAFNYKERIPEALLDRMTIIEMDNYKEDEVKTILENYIIRSQTDSSKIIFKKSIINYLYDKCATNINSIRLLENKVQQIVSYIDYECLLGKLNYPVKITKSIIDNVFV